MASWALEIVSTLAGLDTPAAQQTILGYASVPKTHLGINEEQSVVGGESSIALDENLVEDW